MRPLRDRTPDKLHLITCRTRGAELLLVPRGELNNCIGGIVAKYAELYGVKLYAICVLSNHYHLLVSSSNGNLSLFAENVNREISKRVNRMLGRKGSLWGRRYDDQVVIEAKDGIEGLLYVLTNPVRHGLVTHPKLWPGVTSYWQSLGAAPKSYRFLNYSEFSKAKRRAKLSGKYVRAAEYETEHVLRISVLPELEGLPVTEIAEKIEARTQQLVVERKKASLGFLGRKNVLAQPHSGTFPKDSSQSPRPAAYTKCLKALARFKEELKLIRAAYTEASIKYRLGQEGVCFPPFCFLPPRHHLPKLIT